MKLKFQEKEKKLNKKIIYIEGLPSAGKFILANLLSNKLSGTIHWTDYSANSFLKDFFLVDEINALATEVSLLIQRREVLKNILQPGIFKEGPSLTDSSLHKGRIYASCTLNSEEYSLFLNISSLILDSFPEPDIIIYLRTNPNIIKNRLSNSSYTYEKDIDKEYLFSLSKAMDDYLLNLPSPDILVVNGFEPENEIYLNGVINEVINFNGGISYYNIGDSL